MPERRFSAKLETTQRDLVAVIRAMGATSLQINQDILKGSVEIVFDREGQRYVFRCSKYPDSLDNLRATQLAITYLWRAIERYVPYHGGVRGGQRKTRPGPGVLAVLPGLCRYPG